MFSRECKGGEIVVPKLSGVEVVALRCDKGASKDVVLQL